MKKKDKMFVILQIDKILVVNLRSQVFRNVSRKYIGVKSICNIFQERLHGPIITLDLCLNDELYKK
jgi:hypothetical protein